MRQSYTPHKSFYTVVANPSSSSTVKGANESLVLKAPVHGRRLSLYKTISWRLIGSTDTFLIAWLVSGVLFQASMVAIAEFLTKPVLFYLHERLWARMRFGLYTVHKPSKSGETVAVVGERKRRSVYKAISWRLTATLDTTIISMIVIGSLPTALAIGSIELLTKTILYYYHERFWERRHIDKQAQ